MPRLPALPVRLRLPLLLALPFLLASCDRVTGPGGPSGSRVAAVSAEPDSVLLAAGRSFRFRQPFVDPDSVAAYAPLVLVQRDAQGNVLPPEPFTFESSDTTVVTVTDTALIGHSPGEAVVTVKVGKASAQLVVRVVAGYEVTALGALDGDTASRAMGINDAGVVVGYSRGADASRPVVWRDGAPSPLSLPGTPGSVYSAEALRVNDAGQIAGTVDTDQGSFVFLLNGASAAYTAYDGGGGPIRASLRDLNDRGEILMLHTATGCCGHRFHGPYVIRDGVEHPLGLDVSFEAAAIDDEGVIVGASYRQESTPNAAIYADGELTVLDSDFSGAGAVSSRGRVVAGFATGGAGVVATLWSGGEETVLQPLRGTVIDQATMVDTAGVVAGFARHGHTGAEVPVIWRGGVVARADDLVLGPWTMLRLEDLNEAGQLVGHGRNTQTGEESAVLLTPR